MPENLLEYIPEGILAALLALVGYQGKRSDGRIDRIELSLEKLALTVAKDYITREETNRLLYELKSSLQRIENKIDGKADK